MDDNALAREELTTDALVRSEARFRRLFEAARDGILILDAGTGAITAINPFLCTLLGYPESEMLGKKLWEIGPFEDEHTSRIAFSELKSNEYIRYEDLPLQTRDGRSVDVEFVSNVYEVAGERVIQCNIRDVRERKHIEEAAFLAARVTALRAAVGLALSESTTFPDALRVCAEAFVMHFSSALAQIWTFHEGDRALFLQAHAGLHEQPDVTLGGEPTGHSMIQRIIESGSPVVSNDVFADPHVSDHAWAAREGIVAFAGFPLKVEGRVVGVLALFAQEPLTDAVLATLNSLPNHLALSIDRHQRAQDLARVEERMRFAVENAQVGIWDMDYITGVLDWSSILEAQYGLAPGGFEGTLAAFFARIHSDDRAMVEAALARAARGVHDFTVSHRIVRPNGEVRWLRSAGRIALDVQGTPVRASGISLDVTDLVSVQAQRQQAQKMEAIGRLAGGIAHDFNNLLTVILGFSEMVISTLRADDPHRSDLMEIQKAGTRAAGLTSQLLTFSRRSVIELKPLNVNEVITDLTSMLARLLGEDVHIVTELDSGTSRVMADRGQMEQVIVNLAVNAKDAMKGGGTLTISTANILLDETDGSAHPALAPGLYLRLAVSDTGGGMTPDVLAHLFEPFFTTKALGEGTGLGLATVHGIVLQRGGSIDVTSELGTGSTVQVMLPLADAATAIPESDVESTRSIGGAETILVVEDSDALRAVTRRILERVGYTVLVASNATEATLRLERSPSIDLVLTDVVMPGGNGPELVDRLVARQPHLRAIFMSGYSEDAVSHRGVLTPGIAFLQKPFDAAALQQKVRTELDRARVIPTAA